MSEHVLEHLSAYLDGALSTAERERFRAHLSVCGVCSKRLEELAAVDASLRDLPALAPEGYFEGLPSRVRSRLSASGPARRRLLRAPVWTLAAAAALMVGVLAPLTLLKQPATPDVASARPPDRALAPAAEADKLAQAPQPKAEMQTVAARQRGDAALPAIAPATPTSAAPAEDFRRRGEPRVGAIEKTKAEAESARLEEPVAVPEAPAPAATSAPAAGFAEAPRPPAQMTDQFGPRVSQQLEQRRQAPAKQSADAPANADMKGRVGVRAADSKDAAASTDRAVAKSVELERGEREAGLAASRVVADLTSYRDLLVRTPRDAAEARSLRDSWRRLSLEAAGLQEADEARVRVIQMGLLAWRFEQRPEDRSLAEKDATAYLARADARQTARVRDMLTSVGR